ncbi:HEAT repeat domain-containing protein [Streptomyces rishiriensis]|uniref:HEAT repeat protein n=1 Tax=Streptomyces rishiriensis TaxID=68264 RepID=A0ABU0NPW1_STRRH|nr:HEAT repeat domain-containing protein [Streptomyces rishiriensis]MDQ0580587.1 HEAT repeat protein [Streptomyces rishiriensis]
MGTERDRADLDRAYGSPEDVPALLRALESADEAVRERAVDRLYSCLCFREEVPTAPVAPHLVRLALHGAGPRAELLRLLANLANWAGHPDERRRVRQAVAEAMPSLRPLAHDADPGVREAMVLLIAACGREAGPTPAPLLRDRLAEESDPLVRARIVTALGLLEPGDGGWRHGLLADPEPRVALAAAEDLLRTTEPPLPHPLVDTCARAFTAVPDLPEEPETSLWPAHYRPLTERLLEDPGAALRALAQGMPLAFEITEQWRDREADVLPWALRETEGEAWQLYRLAQLACALPPELHARVRERVLPCLADGSPAVRAGAVTALARARVPAATAVEETLRLIAEAPGAYDTVRAVRAVTDEFAGAATPVARAVARQSGEGHSDLVKVLTKYPEVAAEFVEELAGLLTRHGTGYPSVAVAVLSALGRAAGEVGERALRTCVREGVHSSVSGEAAVALWPVAADPEPALSFLRRELTASASSWATDLAGRLGAVGAPLLPFVEPLLARRTPSGNRAAAALAVWRITGRTEDTVDPLAREALAWKRFYPGPPHPVATLTEMGLLPRFAVEPLRRGAESPRRAVKDLMYGDAAHPDDVLRAAVRKLLTTARVVD